MAENLDILNRIVSRIVKAAPLLLVMDEEHAMDSKMDTVH